MLIMLVRHNSVSVRPAQSHSFQAANIGLTGYLLLSHSFSSMTSPGSSPRRLPLVKLKICDLTEPRARFTLDARCDNVAPLKVFANRTANGGSGGQGVLLRCNFADETGMKL